MVTQEQFLALEKALIDEDTLTMESLVLEVQPADLANYIDAQDLKTSLKLITYLPLEARAVVFGYLDVAKQKAMAIEMTEKGLSQLFMHMPSDERADLFNELSEVKRQNILRFLAQEEREDIRRLASYEEGTTGSIMSSDYVTLEASIPLETALERVRHTAPNAETVYQVYVVNAHKQLIGVVSLRQLIVSKPELLVEQIMTKEVVSIQANELQEEASRLISRYGLLALPVIDTNQCLVGIVTYDDAMDVATEEATEDIYKGASVAPSLQGFGQASTRDLYWRRINWLVLLVFANIFSGAGIAYFEATLAAQVALVFFLPLLIGSGGNAGAQSATLVIRGLATEDISAKDLGKLLGRDFLVALLLGCTMALAVVGIGYWRGGTELAQVVALSMLVIVVMGSLIGLTLPFMLLKAGWDPATASGPLVTSIADILGVLIYFSIATAILTV